MLYNHKMFYFVKCCTTAAAFPSSKVIGFLYCNITKLKFHSFFFNNPCRIIKFENYPVVLALERDTTTLKAWSSNETSFQSLMVQPLEDKKKRRKKHNSLSTFIFNFYKKALKRALKGTVFNGQTLIDEC